MLAVFGIATTLMGFVTSVFVFLVSLRNGRKTDQVHVLVDGRLTAVVARVTQLIDAMETAGVPVPKNPSPGDV